MCTGDNESLEAAIAKHQSDDPEARGGGLFEIIKIASDSKYLCVRGKATFYLRGCGIWFDGEKTLKLFCAVIDGEPEQLPAP
jgi:hypothetical protein